MCRMMIYCVLNLAAAGWSEKTCSYYHSGLAGPSKVGAEYRVLTCRGRYFQKLTWNLSTQHALSGLLKPPFQGIHIHHNGVFRSVIKKQGWKGREKIIYSNPAPEGRINTTCVTAESALPCSERHVMREITQPLQPACSSA